MTWRQKGKPDARPIFRVLAGIWGAAMLFGSAVRQIGSGKVQWDAVEWFAWAITLLVLAFTGRWFGAGSR
ncbi:MAG TPA: hypothetical protein VMD30_02730 [Tepidisphaeraceae bacterium]|nr:hypothetical protein [Tepidisphaeraceae bacterium]